MNKLIFSVMDENGEPVDLRGASFSMAVNPTHKELRDELEQVKSEREQRTQRIIDLEVQLSRQLRNGVQVAAQRDAVREELAQEKRRVMHCVAGVHYGCAPGATGCDEVQRTKKAHDIAVAEICKQRDAALEVVKAAQAFIVDADQIWNTTPLRDAVRKFGGGK